jgi:hypothetical protein
VLVSYDTRNPPRDIDGECGIFGYIKAALPDFRHEVLDMGQGCVCLLSVRGESPRVLFNCHLDTVPAAAGWSAKAISKPRRPTRDVSAAAAAAALLPCYKPPVGLGSPEPRSCSSGCRIAPHQDEIAVAFRRTRDDGSDGVRCVSPLARRARLCPTSSPATLPRAKSESFPPAPKPSLNNPPA